MEAVPEHPREDGGEDHTEQETSLQEPAVEPKQPALKRVSTTTSQTSRGTGSTSSAPGGRRRSRKGSIFVADEPFADSLTAYVPEEPDDDVFELNTISLTSDDNNIPKPSVPVAGINGKMSMKTKVRDSRFCQRKRIVRIIVLLCLLLGLALGLIFGMAIKKEHDRTAGSEDGTVLESYGRDGIWNNIRLPKTLTPLKYNLHIRTDLTNFTFNGTIDIFIKCIKNTEVVLIHSTQLEIPLHTVTIHPENMHHEKDRLHLKRDPWFHEEHQYLVVELKTPLKAGSVYKFSAMFSAPLLHDYNAGYYRTPYDTATGERWNAATLTALTLARRVFPCFDEPSFKANFTLTLDHEPNYVAIANMPIESNTTLEDGWVRSKFEESVPISTYLVAWCVTDFAYKEITTQNGVLMRVWAREDAVDTVEYALQIGATILDFFDEYFGTKFPLPKLDSIALPGFPYGGMENWGLISYKPSRFLYKESVSPARNKEGICSIVAHELAHQWFGNSVTLKWWDDTWLNEGFASYVGPYIGANHAEPEWGLNDMFTIRSMHPVMTIDSLSTSRPISLPVATNEEILQQFDLISYRKGASIIRMCSNFLGEATFRKGLKKYLAEFEYGNAVRDDLWKHLNDVAKEDGRLFIDVKEIMDTWTLQMGYPVVTVTREYGRADGNLHFRTDQERFLLNPQSNMTTNYGDLGYKWFVPLTYTTSRDAQFDMPSQEWLSPGHKLTVSVTGVEESDWLFVNVEARGYYRVNYDENNWQLLTQQLVDNHQVFGVTSRSALISDAFNLARAGSLNQVIALNITQYLTSERDYVPWVTVKDVTGYIGDMLGKTGAYGDFQKYMLHLVTPLYQDLGWTDPGTHVKRQAQGIAVSLACSFGNEHCVTEASRLFAEWMQNPSVNPIPPDVKQAVYCTAIQHGDQKESTFAMEQLETTNSDTEKLLLREALACTQMPWLLQSYLTDTLDTPEDTKTVLANVAKNSLGARMVWDFFWENWDVLRKTYGDRAFYFADMVSSITAKLNTKYELKQLQSLIKDHPDQGSAERALQQAVESTQANIRWIQNNYNDVATWLSNQIDTLGL
ncbi:aminopeptidase N-like isoform X2 [Amphiura filiformis]|uniref:aminopeptidase N-like isoform X2 n=1 Tax=Amphiura filiformis TaxID=82378 RepID=UPI003B227E92